MGSHCEWLNLNSLTSSLMTCLLVTLCTANNMDPHVYPEKGPFFEGWYLRIIDPHQNISLGFMFGHVLPPTELSFDVQNPCVVHALEPLPTDCSRMVTKKQPYTHFWLSMNGQSTYPPVFVGLLLSLDKHDKLYNPGGYFNSSQYIITKNGQPITTNPDNESPPNFEVKIGSNFSFIVNSNGSKFSVIVGDHILQGQTTEPIPWGPEGEGPESWLENLPLPFHWFVYSLRSTVKSYRYVNKETGQVISGNSDQGVPIVAHMEKNWGNSFPKAWIWCQGVDPRSKVSFVFSAGLVTAVGFDIKVQLSGYRNPGKQINCNFNPANSWHSLDFDGCAGTVLFKVESLTCAVNFEVSAPIKSFSSCLSAPMSEGFKKGCTESFVAVANITVYQRDPFSMVLTDNQIIHLSALEFGEAYMCNGQCPVE